MLPFVASKSEFGRIHPDALDAKRSERQRSRLRGRVYFNQGGSLPCRIRDISYEGARIELLDSIDILAQVPFRRQAHVFPAR